MQWEQYECVPKYWMTEEQFGRDWFEYIWRNIHLDCQPDPGNKLVNADVTDNNDGFIIPEKEEEEEDKEDEEDLTEDKKLKRESSGLRIRMCLLQVMMKMICQLIAIQIKTTMMVEMLSCGIKEQSYSLTALTNLVEHIANILDLL